MMFTNNEKANHGEARMSDWVVFFCGMEWPRAKNRIRGVILCANRVGLQG